MRTALVLPMLAIGLVAGCGGGDDAMSVGRARIGAAPLGTDAALYVEVSSSGDDRLIGVDSDIAAVSSLHRTDSDGIMIGVDAIELPAGTPVRLEPFGDHVMLEDVQRELEPGDQVVVTLRFERHAPVEVTADVAQLYDLAWEDS